MKKTGFHCVDAFVECIQNRTAGYEILDDVRSGKKKKGYYGAFGLFRVKYIVRSIRPVTSRL